MRSSHVVGIVCCVVVLGDAWACVGDTQATGDGGGDATTDGGGGDGPIDDAQTCDASSCGGQCVDLQTSEQNCGACGHACGSGFTCMSGKCGDDVVDVAAGGADGCVVFRDGRVACWGMNSFGQTGTDPSNADDTCGIDKCRATPTLVAGLDTVSQVSLGGDFGCAVRTDGTVLCWGNNQYGQLARALGNPPYAAAPAAVALPIGKKAAKVSCGEGVACVRTLTNEVYCWGDDRSHMIGTGNTPVVTATPVVFSSTQDVTDIAVSYGAYNAGFQHACALRSDKTVWCWGSNNANELGHAGGTQGDVQNCQIPNTANYYNCNPTPVQVVPAISGATAVSSGVFSSCALGPIGAVCWGDNTYNQAGSTGPGSNMFQPNPVVGVPSPDAGAAALAVLLEGGYHLAAIDGNKQLWSWGSNRAGQIGIGVADGGTCAGGGSGCVAPTQTLPTIARLSAGYTFALALQTDGKVMAWGANDEAQLAHLPNATNAGDLVCGSGTCNPTPKAITNLP